MPDETVECTSIRTLGRQPDQYKKQKAAKVHRESISVKKKLICDLLSSHNTK